MFTTIIVQPIFNLLVLIYGILPGHNFGLAIIIFTIIVRMLMWPLVKKQLRQVKLMRKLQPELKRIKKAAAGNRQKESAMMMELYKERGISPFGQIGVMLLQVPILIGLYSGLRRIVDHQQQIVSFAYSGLQHLPWMRHVATNVHKYFDSTLFGVVDLSRSALGPKGVYWPAMVIVVGSAVVQFYQSKQLTPNDKSARKLRDILRDTKSGKSADQSEINGAIGRSTRYFLPILIFLFTVNIPSALSLYWLVGGIVAFIQQSIILREDTEEMEEEADTKAKVTSKAKAREQNAIEAEVVEAPKTVTKSKTSSKKSAAKKRRK